MKKNNTQPLRDSPYLCEKLINVKNVRMWYRWAIHLTRSGREAMVVLHWNAALKH